VTEQQFIVEYLDNVNCWQPTGRVYKFADSAEYAAQELNDKGKGPTTRYMEVLGYFWKEKEQ